jgi:hypothetical protein
MTRLLLITAGLVLLASPNWLPPTDLWLFPVLSLAFTAIVAALMATWIQPPSKSASVSASWTIAVGVAAAVLLGTAAHRFVVAVLFNPADPVRGDMLTVIELAGRKFMNGGDPYGVYAVPWQVHLPYGPPLWAPFMLPEILRIDLRLLTVFGQLFVPVCCAAVAIYLATRGRLVLAAGWLVLLAALVFDPDLLRFALVGHTPAYWPLLPLFACLLVQERWSSAAITLGILVAARSTMIAMVPVFVLIVWYRQPSLALRSAVVWGGATAALLLPFFLWDPAAMWSGMITNYLQTIKEVVWRSNDGGAIRTIGLTGWLLSHHLDRLVEASQLLALAVVYVVSWLALRRGSNGLPYMGLALFAFSMTTVWPVYYVHFDVMLFWISGAIAEASASLLNGRLSLAWPAAAACSATLVAAMLLASASAHPAIAVAGPGGADFLVQGFSNREDDGVHRYRWATGTRATVLLPRSSASAADIVITGMPFVPPRESFRAATVVVNGVSVGTRETAGGWQTLRFQAPASAWRIGSNELVLSFSPIQSPKELGLSGDARHLALAIERIEVERR